MDGEQVPLYEQDIDKAGMLFDVNIKGMFFCIRLNGSDRSAERNRRRGGMASVR
jgi:hypothetical protein